ncbi:MAG: glycine/betaine/sarcosine/D-proline family reductase selenoprotein B [Chloroflexi bacterium]|nr:glycine/betaine/sarcosine/D-proline family reductase selenoprotein B [Chloroflexota bacterium]
MSGALRVVHFVNQFFGGVGGEEAANIPLEVREGPVGPGRLLQQALGEGGSVVTTLVGGDNYFSERKEEALASVTAALRSAKPDVVVAGPAFDAGRYGLACGEVCKAAQALGIPAVTGMHPENPGILSHGQQIIAVGTGSTPVEMPAALQAMARLALKLGGSQELGPAAEEGYLPRGIRRLGAREAPAATRAVDMALAKISGKPWMSEVPVHLPDRVAPAAPVANLKDATIALVTTGGLVRRGNPDRQSSGNPTRYYRHSVVELESLSGKDWEAYHGGYFNAIVNSNPNYILPLSFMRVLEREGVVGRTHQWIHAMPGVGTPVAKSRRFGEDIARDLKEDGVDGALLVAT